jgi:hypothetical protein
VVGGEGSIPFLVTLFSMPILLLVFLTFVKNLLLVANMEPDRKSVREDNIMNKAKVHFQVFIASAIEVAITLGASLQADGGPLTKVLYENIIEF